MRNGSFGINLKPDSDVCFPLSRHLCLPHQDELNGSGKKKTAILYACTIQIFIVLYAWIEIPFYDNMFFNMYIIAVMIGNYYYRTTRAKAHSKR